MDTEFQVTGKNAAALFTLKVHRGDGMALLAMNWKQGKPPKDFVGFAIEYKEPGGTKYFTLKNRLAFLGENETVDPRKLVTTLSPIQKFRWVHFPRNAEMSGKFTYRITPVFMNTADELSYGESQKASLSLARETYPKQLNVAFTRGFVSSQAFVDRYGDHDIRTLLPAKADLGLKFVPTHPQAEEAFAWMGFEARHAVLELLDEAIADRKAEVRVVAYDLSEPEVVSRLEKLGKRLKIIIDDAGTHGHAGSGESQSEKRLVKSAGRENVKRQHLGGLQHNKTIAVDGPKVQAAVCGSTNFTWRGFYVQNNNAVILRGTKPAKIFTAAFEDYWAAGNSVTAFANTGSAIWKDLGLKGIDAQVGFSPYSGPNRVLSSIAKDIGTASSSLFYSLAFLYQTPGLILNSIKKIQKDNKIFSYGISDRKTGGLDLQKPDGKVKIIQPQALSKNVPAPFKAEPTGGGGNRLHHKFVVVDFDTPDARVYLGSYNFSVAADEKNGENLLVIRDRRVAVSYMIEALRIFDHYHFRVAQAEAKKAGKKKLHLVKPPRKTGDKPWWQDDYTNARKIRDRELFS